MYIMKKNLANNFQIFFFSKTKCSAKNRSQKTEHISIFFKYYSHGQKLVMFFFFLLYFFFFFFQHQVKNPGDAMLLPLKMILHQKPSVILLNCIISSISILGFYLIIFFYSQIAILNHTTCQNPATIYSVLEVENSMS